MERQPIQRPELSEQFMADKVYYRFIRLAQLYGRPPKIDYDYPDSEEREKVLQHDSQSLNISNPDKELAASTFYILTGVEYGPDSRTVEIYYEKGDKATKMMLLKGKRTGSVHIRQTRFFDIDRNSGVAVMTPAADKKTKVDIFELNEVLTMAESVLERQYKEKITALEHPVRIPLRMRINNVLESIYGRPPKV